MSITTVQDVGGVGSVLTSVSLWSVKRMNLADINDIILIVTAIVGLGWAVNKFIASRLDIKIKRNELKKDIGNNSE